MIVLISISSLRHAYPENAGFRIDRKNGHPEYTFLHFHNSVEIVLDGERIHTAPHAVILYKMGTPQYFESQTPLLHDWMHFSGDAEPILRENGIQPDKLYYPFRHQFITELIGELETEFYDSRKNREKMLALKTEEFFLKLGRAICQEEVTDLNRETIEKFRYLRGKVFSSLEKNWSISEMAKEVYLSESRVFAVYKMIYGISPNADLIRARINSAKNLLAFSQKKVEEIAFELGYQNATLFSRQFKKYTGCTPSEYRLMKSDKTDQRNK